MADFKEMLKYLRKREGLSQAELASRLNLSPATISMYEVGLREPNFETEEAIADYFNVDLNTLRGKDYEMLMYDLTPAGERLINTFKKLNSAGKEKLLSYADDLISLDKYSSSNL